MKTKMIEKLIKQAKAGGFGENFVSIGENAEKELEGIKNDIKKTVGLEINKEMIEMMLEEQE